MVRQTEYYTSSCSGRSAVFYRRESSVRNPSSESVHPNLDVAKSEAYLWGSNSSHQEPI
jgi:tRNA(Phe) wybutosine-synthesizing methylase Tyw3